MVARRPLRYGYRSDTSAGSRERGTRELRRLRWLYLFVICSLVASLAPGAPAPVALAESGVEGWIGVYGWTKIERSAKQAYFGDESLRVTKQRTARVATFQPGLLIPGKEYTFSVYARLESGERITDDILKGWLYEGVAEPKHIKRDLDSGKNRPDMRWVPTGEGWYRGRFSFTAKDPVAFYGVLATMELDKGESYYLDAAQLEEGHHPTAFKDKSVYDKYLSGGQWDPSDLITASAGPAYYGAATAGSASLQAATIHNLGFGPSDGARVDRMVRAIRPQSPLVGKGELIVRLGQAHKVDPLLIMQWHLESQMGTTGVNSPENGGNLTWAAARPYAREYGCTPGPTSLNHLWAACPSVEAGLGIWFNYVGSRYKSFANLDQYFNTYNPCSDPGNIKNGFPCGTRAGNTTMQLIRKYAGPPTSS